jgi:hypothetical protein
MSELSQTKKPIVVAPPGMSMIDQIMQGYKEGSMSQAAQKIEEENPFKNINPIYQPEQINEPIKKRPTKAEIDEIFNKPRNPKWENMRLDIEGPVFTPEYEAAQKVKLHKAAMGHKEDFYKEKFPESEEIPKGRSNYNDNLFEKMFQANIEAQKRAAEAQENSNKLSNQQYDFNQQMWQRNLKQNNLYEQKAKIAKSYADDTNKYSSMAAISGMPAEYINLVNKFNERKRIKANQDINDLGL